MKIYCFNGFQQVRQAIDNGAAACEIRVTETNWNNEGIVSGFRYTDGWAKDVDAIAKECNRHFEGEVEFSIYGPYKRHEEYYLLEMDYV